MALSAILAAALTVMGAPATAVASQTTVTVNSTTEWPGTATGVTVSPGDILQFTASGRATFGGVNDKLPNCPGVDETEPGGDRFSPPGAPAPCLLSTDPRTFPGCGPRPNVAVGTLLGSIGRNGDWFVVGRSSQYTVPSGKRGELYLQYNDCLLTDNRGSYQVTIGLNVDCVSPTPQQRLREESNPTGQPFVVNATNQCINTQTGTITFDLRIVPNANVPYSLRLRHSPGVTGDYLDGFWPVPYLPEYEPLVFSGMSVPAGGEITIDAGRDGLGSADDALKTAVVDFMYLVLYSLDIDIPVNNSPIEIAHAIDEALGVVPGYGIVADVTALLYDLQNQATEGDALSVAQTITKIAIDAPEFASALEDALARVGVKLVGGTLTDVGKILGSSVRLGIPVGNLAAAAPSQQITLSNRNAPR